MEENQGNVGKGGTTGKARVSCTIPTCRTWCHLWSQMIYFTD